MEKIKVKVNWSDKNFAAVTDDARLCGMVLVTASTYEKLMSDLRDAIVEHVEGVVADGDDLPEWLKCGVYEFEVDLGAAALLRCCLQYTTFAAVAHATGINQALLTHYVTGLKVPRDKQRARIVEGLHRIGEALLSLK